MTGATPCCHTQLTPVMWPFGSAVRVLDTALRSWRSAALLVSKHTPPSLHLHLHLSQRRNRTTTGGGGEDDTVCDCNRGTPFPARPPPGDRRLGPIRPSGGASRSSRKQLRSAPGRFARFSPLENSLFPGIWMNYWRVANKCEKKAEARDLPPRSVQGRQYSARVVDDNGGDVPVSSFCYFTDAM